MAGVTVEGAEHLRHTLLGIGRRATGWEPVAIPIFGELAAAESALFAKLHGQFVRTGATRDSLTVVTGRNAVRRVNPTTLDFGTSVFYAKFLRKGPTAAGARKGRTHGRSAVMISTSTVKRRIGRTVLNYVMEGPG